jgi:hypothetical protein
VTYKIVLVKGVDGQMTPFALLYSTPSAVFVCRKEAYEDIVSGRRDPPMIGFPLDDVFEADGQRFVPGPDMKDAA